MVDICSDSTTTWGLRKRESMRKRHREREREREREKDIGGACGWTKSFVYNVISSGSAGTQKQHVEGEGELEGGRAREIEDIQG